MTCKNVFVTHRLFPSANDKQINWYRDVSISSVVRLLCGVQHILQLFWNGVGVGAGCIHHRHTVDNSLSHILIHNSNAKLSFVFIRFLPALILAPQMPQVTQFCRRLSRACILSWNGFYWTYFHSAPFQCHTIAALNNWNNFMYEMPSKKIANVLNYLIFYATKDHVSNKMYLIWWIPHESKSIRWRPYSFMLSG